MHCDHQPSALRTTCSEWLNMQHAAANASCSRWSTSIGSSNPTRLSWSTHSTSIDCSSRPSCSRPNSSMIRSATHTQTHTAGNMQHAVRLRSQTRRTSRFALWVLLRGALFAGRRVPTPAGSSELFRALFTAPRSRRACQILVLRRALSHSFIVVFVVPLVLLCSPCVLAVLQQRLLRQSWWSPLQRDQQSGG